VSDTPGYTPPDPIPELVREPFTPRVLDERPVAFHELVRDLWRGSIDDEATAELNSVVEAVAALGKPGSLTFTIEVDPSGHGATVILAAKIKTKAPQPPPEVGTLFVGDHGSLHRNDPFRPSMIGHDAKAIDDAIPEPKRLD
jgi:hypothetical protein